MEPRFNYRLANPEAAAAMARLQQAVAGGGLEHGLLLLIEIRASQINHCGF